jgi:mannose-6-phosphate isomerase/beta-glucosidase
MILKLKPVFKSKIWGGTKLIDRFHYKTNEPNIGECWGVSAIPGSESTIDSTPFEGWSLKRLWEQRKDLFGHHPALQFPLLVKFIDAADDLSIQVHPDDAYASKVGSYGKTECWTILDADEDSTILVGHHAKSQDEFMRFIEGDRYLDLVKRYPLKKGDRFFIEPGTIHAICKGTTLLEIQQSSDLTYRFYDYGRLENGKPRPLHLEDAIAVSKIPDDQIRTDFENPYFEVVDPVGSGIRSAGNYGDFLIVLSGQGTLDQETVYPGTFYFVPSHQTYTITGNLEIVIARMK